MEHHLSTSSKGFSGKKHSRKSCEGECFDFLVLTAREEILLDEWPRLFDTNSLSDGIGQNSDSLPPRNYPDCSPRGNILGFYLPHNLVIIYSSGSLRGDGINQVE